MDVRNLYSNLLYLNLKKYDFKKIALLDVDRESKICFSVYPHKKILEEESQKEEFKSTLFKLVKEIDALRPLTNGYEEVFDDHEPIFSKNILYFNSPYDDYEYDKKELLRVLDRTKIKKQSTVITFKIL